MARKHNTKHDRSPSRYKNRLAKRGLSATPRMKWSHCDGAMSQQDIAKALKTAMDNDRKTGRVVKVGHDWRLASGVAA